MEGLSDFSNVVVGGVLLIPFVLGITQFIKDWLKLDGNKVRLVGIGVTALLYILWGIRVYLPPAYTEIYTLIMSALAVSFAAFGLYQFDRDRQG